jgi:hypothetical protein
MGNVEVRHDASQHATHHSSSSSHTHHEDKSQHIDQSTKVEKTSHGMHPMLVVVLVCVIFVGSILIIVATRSAMSSQSGVGPLAATVPPTVVVIEQTSQSAKPAEKNVSPPAAATSGPLTQPPHGELQLALNQSSYKEGDLMEITLSTRQAGHLYVLAVWADGRVDTLFPNSLRPESWIEAGTRLTLPADLPPTKDGRVLTYPMAMPDLPGQPAQALESILAVLSPEPLNLPKSTELASSPGFAALGMMQDPGFRTRGPQPQFIDMRDVPRLDFGDLPQAAVHYRIQP